jgi:glutathione S-transferase
VPVLPEATPAPLRDLVGALPGGLIGSATEAIRDLLGPCEVRQLHRSLEQLALLVAQRPYLEGDGLTLADLSVVAQLYLLKFSTCAGAQLAGRGVEGIADNPVLEPLFAWRDRVLTEVGRG